MDKMLENADQEQKILLLALLVSISLHILVVTLLPYLEAIKQSPALQRIEMEVFQTMPPTQQAPQPPMPLPPKGEQMENPLPVQKPQKVVEKKSEPTPVLATESPAQTNDYQVAHQAEPTQQAIPTSETAAPSEKSAPTIAAYGKPNGIEDAIITTDNANESATPEEAWDGYGQQLYDLVNQGKNYPAIAIRRNWEGEVKLKVKFILGKLTSVEIIDVSAHKPLDDEALKMVNNAVKALAIKGKLAKKTFTVFIPVSFKLDKS